MDLVKEKINQAKSILRELDIDLWITYVRKTSEITDPSLFFLSNKKWFTWQTALILTKSSSNIAIAGRYDIPNIEGIGVYDEIISYDESIEEPLIQVLKNHNPKKIAINYSEDNVAADGLTHGLFIKLSQMLEKTPYKDRLISSEHILAALRGRKTPKEISRIKEAIKISQLGHQKIRDVLKIGMSEKEIEEILEKHNEEHKVTFSYPPLINVGPNTTIGHGGPSPDIKVGYGDLINLDYGVFVADYASDIQRLSYVMRKNEKSPPHAVKKAFTTCIDAITKASDVLKPGVKGWEIDNIARSVITNAGYDEFKHALGHQVGLNVHDGGCLLGPRWERYGKSPYYEVEQNQVFTLELHVFIEKHGFCSIEEMVQITEDGCKFLSDRQTELSLLYL